MSVTIDDQIANEKSKKLFAFPNFKNL